MMRYIAPLLSGTLLGAPAKADQFPPPGWSRISDVHGSSLEIPTALLKRKRDPRSLVFVSNDAARITFETITEPRPGFPGNDPEGDMSLKRSDCTAWPPSYRVLKDSLAAYSCVRGATVVYYVARYSRSGSIVLHAEYPRAHNGVWDRVVARISASMRQVGRQELGPG